jgi:molybdopterin converting factor small subunit
MIRLKSKRTGVYAEGARLDRLLKTISREYKEIELKDLRNSIIFINGVNMLNLKGFKTKLEHGDEIQIFSSMGGG